jgi:hypothetical protein
MPAEAGMSAEPSDSPVIKVRLRAGDDRELSGVQLGDVAITGDDPFGELQQRIRGMVDDSAGPGSDRRHDGDHRVHRPLDRRDAQADRKGAVRAAAARGVTLTPAGGTPDARV